MYTCCISEHVQLFKIIHLLSLVCTGFQIWNWSLHGKGFASPIAWHRHLQPLHCSNFTPFAGSTQQTYLRPRLVDFPLYLLLMKCHGMIRRQLAEEPCTPQGLDSDWLSWRRAPSPSEPSGCLRSFQTMFSYTSSFITTIFYGVIPLIKCLFFLFSFNSGSSFIEGKSL